MPVLFRYEGGRVRSELKGGGGSLVSLITSEAGLAGHPDKVADGIGDAVLDAYLAQDDQARVGCQVMVANGLVLVGGQITANASVDIGSVVRDVLEDVGYGAAHEGLSPDSEIIVRVEPQSREIGAGVDRGGAGDSAIVIGYACDDTPERMPLSAAIAHAMAKQVDTRRRSGEPAWLRPDGKVQVTAAYENGRVVQVDSLVVSVQHEPDVDPHALKNFLDTTVRETVPRAFLTNDTRLLSRTDVGFAIGGPKADCGLSGRKVIADTYGGVARHGGGGLSGKDPTKIDRCGMYAARYIAKNVVAAGLANQCEVHLAFMIGHPEPVAIMLDCRGTNGQPIEAMLAAIKRVFPLSPASIIDRLTLRRPLYRKAGMYGHFGHEGPEFPWEACDMVDDLLRAL